MQRPKTSATARDVVFKSFAKNPFRPFARNTVLAVLGASCAFQGSCSEAAETAEHGKRAYTRVLHEVAFEPDLWQTVSYGKGGAPEVGVITPSMKADEDGGDTPGLLLPPPSVVRFTVPEGSGGPRGNSTRLWLKGRTGVDVSARQALPEDVPGVEITLTVEVDGKEAWSNAHILRRKRGRDETLLWKDLPSIPLEPGQVVTLSSRISKPAESPELPRLAVGFGALELVQDGEKQLVPSSPERPNIVLIVMDTLRQDHLSCYGFKPGTTPALDALAARGVLYENAYATSSWTWPSTASILTGLSPEAHGVRSSKQCLLSQSLQTLPELLSERKLITGAITCNPLIVPDKNFDQGFDYFDSAHNFRRTSFVIEATRDWLRLHAGSRFFLYLQYIDTHEDYHPTREALARVGGQPPEDYPRTGMRAYHQRLLNGEGHDEAGNSTLQELIPPAQLAWMQRSYEAAVISADHFVGQVLAELRELGLEDRTIVAFTSDHGEELGEHGLLTHGHTLHPEVMRVPLILAGPGLPVGERVSTPVSNRHLAPSLAALANAAFEHEQDSLNLLTPAALHDQAVYFSTEQGWWNGVRNVLILGVREGDWELHWAPRGVAWGGSQPTENGQARLYRLSSDPEQHLDLAAEFPERAEKMLERLRQELERNGRYRPKSTVGAGKRSTQALVGIGYLGAEEVEDEDRQATNE